ncbi:hypothetical protein NCG97_24800 [Streptomyces lydicamycinicus]|nr:hypothetical protein [Streptomyces lydicamycinicus]USA03138.1 hypothetical protein NCG97_24800 [Streptomyces lydicamycinicus]
MTAPASVRLDALLARSAQVHPDRTALEGPGRAGRTPNSTVPWTRWRPG